MPKTELTNEYTILPQSFCYPVELWGIGHESFFFNKCIQVHIRNTDNDRIHNNMPSIMVISNIAIMGYGQHYNCRYQTC